jgi:hypothetical protein
MSADTNNISGIRGVTPPTRNPNHGEILVCAIRLPKFPVLCTAASLDATPSTLPPSTPHHHTNPVADPAFGLDAAGSAPVVVPDPVTPSPTQSRQPRC